MCPSKRVARARRVRLPSRESVTERRVSPATKRAYGASERYERECGGESRGVPKELTAMGGCRALQRELAGLRERTTVRTGGRICYSV